MARPLRLQWPVAAAFAAALAAGGCVGLSIPMGDLAKSGPAITGSTQAAWTLPAPLPEGLVPSDAAAIAAAAQRLLAANSADEAGNWTNPASGASGTLVPLGEAELDGRETCRTYASTVTSIKGVHIYTCRACQTADGRVVIRSIAPAAQQTAAAGI